MIQLHIRHTSADVMVGSVDIMLRKAAPRTCRVEVGVEVDVEVQVEVEVEMEVIGSGTLALMMHSPHKYTCEYIVGFTHWSLKAEFRFILFVHLHTESRKSQNCEWGWLLSSSTQYSG